MASAPPTAPDAAPEQFAWPVKSWAKAAAISEASTWKLIAENKVESVKFGAKRLVLTHPLTFLRSLAGEAA